MNMTSVVSDRRAALVIAHPGHELCVYGWLETARPRVFVLTDGSGRSGQSRLNSTEEILSVVGACRGSIFGCFNDLSIYAAILEGNFAIFEQLVIELADAFVRDEIGCVSGDAAEGYNTIHDTCRILINAAVELANHISGRLITNTDFLLFGPHTEKIEDGSICLKLDDDRLARKLAKARAYCGLKGEVSAMLDNTMLDSLRNSHELSAEFREVMNAMGSEAYRIECLRRVDNRPLTINQTEEIPFYERYAEERVAAGIYKEAIRYQDHMVPLAEAVRDFVNRQIGNGLSTRAAGMI
jgi:hypothetical protein